MSDVASTLNQRAGTHGDYSHNARVGQELKDLYRKSPGWAKLSPEQKETMDMIAHKQARILGGNPDEKDHWHDIAGYAKLVEDRIVQIVERRDQNSAKVLGGGYAFPSYPTGGGIVKGNAAGEVFPKVTLTNTPRPSDTEKDIAARQRRVPRFDDESIHARQPTEDDGA